MSPFLVVLQHNFGASKFFYAFFMFLLNGLGVETERVPGVETERAMSGPLLRQGVETERECANNVTGVALWRGSKPNARGSKPNAGSISCGRRRLVALSLAKKWLDIILPSMYM